MKRKKGMVGLMGMDRWFWEYFAPYRASDYEGFVEEFLDGMRKRGGVVLGENSERMAFRSKQTSSGSL